MQKGKNKISFFLEKHLVFMGVTVRPVGWSESHPVLASSFYLGFCWVFVRRPNSLADSGGGA